MIELSKSIKHEMAKSFVQAILKHAGYRVINSGMEHVIREVTPLDRDEYRSLDVPTILRMLPDYLVMDRAATRCDLVDVSYRSRVDGRFMTDLGKKAEVIGDFVLVLVHGTTSTAGTGRDLSEIMRCCRVGKSSAGPTVALPDVSGCPVAVPLASVDAGKLWGRMLPLGLVFGTVGVVDPGLEAAIEKAARSFAA